MREGEREIERERERENDDEKCHIYAPSIIHPHYISWGALGWDWQEEEESEGILTVTDDLRCETKHPQ